MNLHSNCNNLDSYLSDDLPVDQRAIFESHLDTCSECRDAVDQQLWIDGLLQSPVRIELEQPTVTIRGAFHSSLAQRRRRVIRAACGLAAAATLLIAVGLLKLNRQSTGTLESTENSIAVVQPTHAPTPAEPRATFVSSSDAIVVPLESPSADVTVVQVYPTTDTERRWRLDLTLSNQFKDPNGG
jgi:anti-sigma factor RsiW